MKAAIKRALKRILPIVAAPKPGGTRILTYHSVGERSHEMNVRTEDFAAQMLWLRDHAVVIPLEAAIDGQPGVALTFDDGFVDNLRNAAPILKAYEFPATVFMVAGRAGGYLDGEPDRERGRLMTWDELRELASLGIEIGAHTLHHPHLAELPAEAQREEIEGSKRLSEQQLGQPVRAFAYPYGSARDYNKDSLRLVQEAGFSHACSNRYGPHGAGDAPWDTRRIWIDATDSLESFADKVTGRLDALQYLDSPLGIRLRRLINR